MGWRGSMGVGIMAFTSASALTAVVSLLVGCGSARPTSESEDVEHQTASIFYVDEPKNLGPKLCDPLQTRACRVNWVDHYGTPHCELSIQYCRSDGFGWRACGDLDAAMSAPPEASPTDD